MAKEVWGYIRVSTKNQNINRQMLELQPYVKKQENILVDHQSGKDFDRPAYNQLKAAIRSDDELYIKSLDRLGRNKKGIKDELQWFRDRGVIVHIIDFPQTMISAPDPRQRELLDLATNIMIEILSYMAETERENIRTRQAEGIAAWKRTGKTKTGRPYGRPPAPLPKNWKSVYTLWKNKQLKTKDAIKLLGICKNTFYRFVKNKDNI